MLNRRILRIKAFKTIYSYAENPAMSLKEALSELDASCESTRDLYLYLLSLVPALTSEASGRVSAAMGKFNPSEEELHPNTRFMDNAIARILSEDPDFVKILSRKKLSWDQNDAFLRHLYDTVRSSSYYEAYMSAPRTDLRSDAALWADLFAAELPDNDELAEILEDMSIHWNDDLEYAVNVCCSSFDDLGRGKPWHLPELYLSDSRKGDPDVQSDRDFVRKLTRCAYNGFGRYVGWIQASVPGWDGDRLFAPDVALIVTGLAEAENFPEIPPRVSLNEYVEISKYYGTPKSRQFVNGLLDKLIKSELKLNI